MTQKRPTWLQPLIVAALVGMTRTAHACATCFGKSDSKLAEGMNWGIFTLLLVVLGVLGGISAFFIFIARRSASLKPNVR